VSYATLTELRSHAQIGDNADDHMLEAALDAAVDQVDSYCRRTFTNRPATRRYRQGRHTARLYVDDAVDVDTVEVDGQVWPDGTWDLFPYNALDHDRPYTAIEGTRRMFVGEVVVTGIFGWPDIPAAVKQATLLQASRLAQRRNAAFGIAQVPGFDGNTGMRLLSKLDADVELLLDPYRRHPVLVR